ncbi:Kinesin light chain [Eumeta japonica]|uniref:Kinesin light chain n=1 Tax=Eumeta variegata TaxID=151549 RepID=A0A4C1WSJ5_EUMVA|nr:Kinesin light chain [Eumeta japonica]
MRIRSHENGNRVRRATPAGGFLPRARYGTRPWKSDSTFATSSGAAHAQLTGACFPSHCENLAGVGLVHIQSIGKIVLEIDSVSIRHLLEALEPFENRFISRCHYFVALDRKKIESLGRMTAMTQEEMVAGVRTVAAGLEALRAEHAQLLAGLAADAGAGQEQEKASLVKKSIEAIELGLGEAQVFIPLQSERDRDRGLYVVCVECFERIDLGMAMSERCDLKEDVVTVVERGMLRRFGHREG